MEVVVLNEYESEEVNGGGPIEMAAGAVAGGMVGAIVSLPYAAVKDDPSAVGRGAILGASVGAFIGAGCPMP